MKQRVVVQAILQSDSKILLLRRSQGRPGIVGKYELPGGSIDDNEQPDDALRRHLRNDVGLNNRVLKLRDVVSIKHREEGDIQHIFIVYTVEDVKIDEPLIVGRSYDAYEWKAMTELQHIALRESTRSLLGVYNPTSASVSSDVVNNNFDDKNTSHTTISQVIIYSDGGSRGNPGPSAAAFVILQGREEILDQGGEYLGITTNNQAEYHGVRLGLEKAIERGIKTVEFRIDSMLVVNQLKGIYKIKNRELWPIHERIQTLLEQFDSVTFAHVPRELNKVADSLVNKLLDEHQNERA